MIYPCWCYDVKWLCCPSMVTLISCSYALLFHYVVSLWLSSSPSKLNLTLIKLEQTCWQSHGATESSSPEQPHLPGWGGPNLVYCHASRRCLQLGKVMCVRYPDQVGGHKPCVPEFYGTDVLIRLQRIYNFWLFHAVILSILDVLYTFTSNYISFFGTNLLT
jgi:hypothetical protein